MPKIRSPIEARRLASAATPAPQRGPLLTVGFVLARRFTLCAFANFVDVLRLAADEGDRSRPVLCEWKVLSPDLRPVVSSCGVSVQPNARPGDPSAFDYIVVVGGLLDESDRLDGELAAFIKGAAAAGVPLIGVGTGSFVLCSLGLMEGYRCCVSWFHHDDFVEEFGGIEPIADRIFVIDRDRLTCSGGVSAAHLAAHLVDRHVGRSQATKSLHIMIIDNAQLGEHCQPGLPSTYAAKDPFVKRALHLMQQRLDLPLTVSSLAAQLDLSRRQLERRFRDDLAISPAAAYLKLRLGYAEQLLATSDRSITAVASQTGFCDASHFIQAFKAAREQTPAAWRAQARREASAGLQPPA